MVIDVLDPHVDACPPLDTTVWTTETGGFLRRGTFARIWRRAVADSVGTPCRIHDLRHTHAAWLIADGSILRRFKPVWDTVRSQQLWTAMGT
jgi:integrase